MSIGEIEKYLLLRHLGNGAFGDVYLAQDRALNATKAIKVLNATNAHEVKRKLEEAQILHKCKHKNIVHVNEANIYDISGSPHVIIDMEYLPNGSFEDAIRQGNISIHSSVRVIIDCLFALEHSHLNGVLHRDVKPANIMLCEYGAKLSDFGLATVLGIGAAGSPKGYTTHLPPEYFTTRSTTELTDIFAVGITLFRACNYIADWDGTIRRLHNPIGLIQAGTLAQAIGYNVYIPLRLKKIINKAISAGPTQRYQSASEFRQSLERLRPGIDWHPSAAGSFEGICCTSGDHFRIELTSTSRSFNVDLKKNNRRQLQNCSSFNDMGEAYHFLHEHIASTLFT